MKQIQTIGKGQTTMKRSKTMKSILAFILCACIAVSGIGLETVSAAGKKIPLKVGFKGETVNLIKDLKDSSGQGDSTKLSSVEKKWGKAKGKKQDGMMTYTWKKGKTKILVNNFDAEENDIGGIEIDIKDENGSLWGVKVGMTKAAALKKIKKALGTKTVLGLKRTDDGLWEIDGKLPKSGVYIAASEETIDAYTGVYMPVTFTIKDGRVTSISFWRS